MAKTRSSFSQEFKLGVAQLMLDQGRQFASEEFIGVPKQHEKQNQHGRRRLLG